ncbi:ABC transporter permease [Caenibacillus caldisaponilyticus]|uniref:ABC transporter permease n=1 Tax=Caenibacillus caldisaponilyticus TaxID=1674942 RepID=UPI0013016411|nr:ABC transporter permease [Caenibacillus caldisaponilyticus]
MVTVEQLWRARCGHFWKIAVRYLRLLANSGFMFSLYIFIVAGGVYYQRWVKGLSDAFPAEWLLTAAFSILIARTPIRTFIQPADLVFLLPLEREMTRYFKRAVLYSALVQSIAILFAWAIAMPLFLQTVDRRPAVYAVVLFLLFMVKAWNLDAAWREHYVTESLPYKGLRVAVTAAFIGFLLFKAPWWTLCLIFLIMVALSVFVYHPLSKKHLLKWEVLLENENRQLARFFRFANLITDVPALRNRVKPRRLLSMWTDVFPFGQASVFRLFYAKTFVRLGDYFGIWFRLTAVGAILILLLPDGWPQLVVAFMAVYLTAVQLLPMWRNGWEDGPALWFPTAPVLRLRGFLTVLSLILVAQSVILSAAVAVGRNGEAAGWALLICVGFSAAFTYGYAARKLGTAG